MAVPADFGTTKNVKVSLRYADIPTLEGYTVNVMGKNGGDVTAVVLENCGTPFSRTEDPLDDNVWGIPTGWKFNDKFYYEENDRKVLIRTLLVDGNNPEGAISLLCNEWANANHKHALENAKMYQITTLPEQN